MSFSLNKQILEGNLGRDPEVFGDEGSIAVLSVATSESWRNKADGEWNTMTTWHRVVLRGSDVEYAQKNLATGDRVYVEGVTRHRKWKGEDGLERSVTEVHANILRLHTKAQRAPARQQVPPQRSPDQEQSQYDDDAVDDPTNIRF